MAKSRPKKTKQTVQQAKKESKQLPVSTNGKPHFRYDYIDKNGKFAFDVERSEFDTHEFMSKMINYSRMTWDEIKRQTHGKRGKSKHHYLDPKGLSKEAKDRLEVMELADYVDDLYSFAFAGMLRIVGIKIEDNFYVLWYDPEHRVYPSKH